MISNKIEEDRMYGCLFCQTHHDGDGNSLDDLLDHGRVRHPSHTSLHSDVSGHSLQGHDGASTSLLGDTGLLDIDDVLRGERSKKVDMSAFCATPLSLLVRLLLLPPATQ